MLTLLRLRAQIYINPKVLNLEGSNFVTCFFYLSQHADTFLNKPSILPAFGAESFSVTVSGFSGGSYMAH